MAGPPAPYPWCPPCYYPPPGYYWPPPQLPTPRAPLQLPALPAPTAKLPQFVAGGASSTAPTGLYTMPTASTLGCPDVVSSTLNVDSHDAHVLFDSGATNISS